MGLAKALGDHEIAASAWDGGMMAVLRRAGGAVHIRWDDESDHVVVSGPNGTIAVRCADRDVRSVAADVAAAAVAAH